MMYVFDIIRGYLNKQNESQLLLKSKSVDFVKWICKKY